MITKCNTLYFSPTGNTAKISQQIAYGLGFKTTEYDISQQQKRHTYRKLVFNNDELVIVGIPVYAGRIPSFLEDYFSELKGNNTPTIFMVTYGNRNYDDALLELKDIFEKRGFKGIAAGAFIGEHSYTTKVATNRPNAEDLKTANKFGLEIKLKLNSHTNLLDKQLIVKGNFPYKERIVSSPMVPQTNDNCTNCGICAKVCPMEAIDFGNFKDINAEKCIRCNCCVKKCPENSKSFTHDAFLKTKQKLISNYSLPSKEPELFFATNKIS